MPETAPPAVTSTDAHIITDAHITDAHISDAHISDPRLDALAARELLALASVDPAVFALRPDYRVLLLTVEGIEPGPGDPASDQLLGVAESHIKYWTAGRPVERLGHVSAWRDAYRSFGAKPQRTRNSLEALTRRAVGAGLPRINRLTDIYNAISVIHQIPIGGEDLTSYAGAPRLIRAHGDEPFDTLADGGPVTEHPDAGEVVWCDDMGVTCRRWNWRQCRRTGLSDQTTRALFILDALDPFTDDDLLTATDGLVNQLRRLGSNLIISRRLIAAGTVDSSVESTEYHEGVQS